MLFADLVGFTELSESRDSEDVRELLSRYFAGARTAVERYGGTIEKFIGDAVMAVWGVPTSHGDDAERAVRAGLDLVEMIEALGEETGVSALRIRVGLVTGEVAVTLGAVGEGMVAGDAVNTASRVQSVAHPGQVWVDDTTRSLTAAAIDYTDAGEHELKGKSRPVRLFAVHAVIGSLGGAARMDGLAAACVGRDRELRLLKELFHSAEEARLPSLVLAEGEAGVGKSRLAWEFFKYVDGLSRDVAWHQGRCLPYGDGVTFSALANAIRPRIGLVDADAGHIVAERLDASLADLIPDEQERSWLRPRLAVLLGVEGGTDGDYQRGDLFVAWTTFLERVGDGEPVVLVIDDAQHADEGLLDFFDHLLSTARFGIFVLALTRPGLVEARPRLATMARTSVLHLEPLAEGQMADLLDSLVEELPDEVRVTLVERAAGIPLFAVETVRALIDQDLVLPRGGRYVLAESAGEKLASMGAPATLQALVTARLDGLSVPERRLVSAASVLGQTFNRAGILSLEIDTVDLDDVLRSLVHKQILAVETERFSGERGSYRFVQSVVCQVAYDTLSRRDRKARHLMVADHLLSDPDRADENAPVIAQHLLDAIGASAPGDTDGSELTERAATLLDRAADRARGLGSPLEALNYLESAIDLTGDSTRRARLHVAAAAAASERDDLEAMRSHAGAALEFYDDCGDTAAAVGAVRWLARADGLAGDPARAYERAGPYWDQLVGNPQAQTGELCELGRNLGTFHLFDGHFTEALPYLDKANAIAESLGDPRHLARTVMTLCSYYRSSGAGRVAEALAWEAVRLARAVDDPGSLAVALGGIAMGQLYEDARQALETFNEVVTVAARSGNVGTIQNSVSNRCSLLFLAGRWDEFDRTLPEPAATRPGDYAMQRSQSLWLTLPRGRASSPAPLPDRHSEIAQDRYWFAHLRMIELQLAGRLTESVAAGQEAVAVAFETLGVLEDFALIWPPAVEIAVEAGELDVARQLLEPVAGLPPGLQRPLLSALLKRLRGLVAVAGGGDLESAEADLRAAIAGFEQCGAPPLRARTQEVLARLLHSVGRTDEVGEPLAAARATYRALGAAGWLAATTDLPLAERESDPLESRHR
ncbi:ATP-binding protein [Leekyejoonella antrihumi]|uniref:ATP-binding protein n=1 Tax=Leekyejoonella antrihumi TaxID=1660198 RepID=UPI001FE3338F|nr:adenylate/guanylate cyclase domain-containing protein [Leekyejoonella antrihumi]